MEKTAKKLHSSSSSVQSVICNDDLLIEIIVSLVVVCSLLLSVMNVPDILLFMKRGTCILKNEREEDSFLVMKLDKKVVQYKIMSKTVITISELGPNDDLGKCFQFIPSFANV
nr:hypothetical protein [Tanacetum cinerariifolium]